MSIELRPYQADLLAEVREEWENGARNVVMRLDTGGGKTPILSHEIESVAGASCTIAHRHVLVSQISLAIARCGVPHDIIGSDATRKEIARAHVATFGRSFLEAGSPRKVASVNTLVKRLDSLRDWGATVQRWIVDEAHHVLRDNMWGKALEIFSHPDCRGLMPTATPGRADRKGLGRHADGIADVMVEGPPMRWLIDNEYLTDYDVICPTTDLEMLDEVGASGDWSTKQLREAAKRSHITGDVVRAYLQYAAGKRTVVFTSDVETAREMVANFIAAGVTADIMVGETRADVRAATLRQFEAGRLQVLVAVDIISEGFDLPAIECVIMARPTASLAMFMQQWGRALRTMDGKLRALIIDMVGNLIRHQGPPDKPRIWSLDRGQKRASGPSDAIPIRVCLECIKPYERVFPACPYCRAEPPLPAGRGSPQAVDGDLAMLAPDVLERLRRAAEIPSVEEYRMQLAATGLPQTHIWAHAKRHDARLDALDGLRQSMAAWGGIWRARGDTDRQMQRRFFHSFGVDVMTAQGLGRADAEKLRDRVDRSVPLA